jgi:RHS repeat-associated protein
MPGIRLASGQRSRSHPPPFPPYNRSHMQPALRSPIPDASLAVFPVNGENSHQGFAGRNPAPHPVREACKFTVLLGLRGQAELNRIGSRCTGKERDAESGLDYFGARFYSSSMGRWMSPDMAGPDLPNPQTLNKYRYALNNPLKYTDPDGLYEHDVHFDLTEVLAYAAGYSSTQSLRIAAADQGIDDSSATGPFSSYSARRDYHFTTPERRAEMWGLAGIEEGLGVYLHAEQDSYSHQGYGPLVGHIWSHNPDKTYSDPSKADAMANDTYEALKQAGINIGTQAGAVPYEEILPFVQAFNRAKKTEDKNEQLNLLRQHVDEYRKNHKKSNKKGPVGSGVCPAQFAQC